MYKRSHSCGSTASQLQIYMHRHQKVCDKLDDLHEHVGSTEGYPTPAHFFLHAVECERGCAF
jgi:hypothetical protein